MTPTTYWMFQFFSDDSLASHRFVIIVGEQLETYMDLMVDPIALWIIYHYTT